MVIRDLFFLKVEAIDDVIQYGRRACAVRDAKETYLLLIITKCMFLSSTKIFESLQTNSVDPDQTAPGAV